jgi:hypothetical protein
MKHAILCKTKENNLDIYSEYIDYQIRSISCFGAEGREGRWEKYDENGDL